MNLKLMKSLNKIKLKQQSSNFIKKVKKLLNHRFGIKGKLIVLTINRIL